MKRDARIETSPAQYCRQAYGTSRNYHRKNQFRINAARADFHHGPDTLGENCYSPFVNALAFYQARRRISFIARYWNLNAVNRDGTKDAQEARARGYNAEEYISNLHMGTVKADVAHRARDSVRIPATWLAVCPVCGDASLTHLPPILQVREIVTSDVLILRCRRRHLFLMLSVLPPRHFLRQFIM